MSEETLKNQFEQWAVAAFGDGVAAKLLIFDDIRGYMDSNINAMWIGFCGHALLAE